MKTIEFQDVPKGQTHETLAFIKSYCDVNRIPLIEYRRGLIDNTYDQFATVWVDVPGNFEHQVLEAVSDFIYSKHHEEVGT